MNPRKRNREHTLEVKDPITPSYTKFSHIRQYTVKNRTGMFTMLPEIISGVAQKRKILAKDNWQQRPLFICWRARNLTNKRKILYALL